MRTYASIEEFRDQRPAGTSWERCVQALQQVSGLKNDVAHSIGDSLTYYKTNRPEPRSSDFVGHRRYRIVLVALEGPVSLSIANKCDLETSEPYSDLSDREYFTGVGNAIELSEGAVLVLGIDEALRFPSECPLLGIVLLTVEAATFHNK